MTRAQRRAHVFVLTGLLVFVTAALVWALMLRSHVLRHQLQVSQTQGALR